MFTFIIYEENDLGEFTEVTVHQTSLEEFAENWSIIVEALELPYALLDFPVSLKNSVFYVD